MFQLIMFWPFQLNLLYHRRNDIHRRFGGQQQGGIATPANFPGVFIFTGLGSSAIGYQNVFKADGTYRYTGQGQRGDMQMVSGNRAIRDHVKSSKDLLLFQHSKKSSLVYFRGLFVCGGWDIQQQPDIDGTLRDAIVFTLVPQSGLIDEVDELATEITPQVSLSELRSRALYEADYASQSNAYEAVSEVRARSKAVRDYILARADGKCERCGAKAPFLTPNGRPYLEAHHIHRLSDGGPDHPSSVVALCPNCHRDAHYGGEAKQLNLQLLERVRQREMLMDL
ncbi:HNH endonuclease [Candidatus Kirkpatrickella diaphorinae]|uniref:HNH endonuclease n=1 Tax=Candidatus Kirkpatrickella diaphorinae TaxID=2984322 RepID=A0ABY6GHK6_9PROT|nr:HNH endonuclease signature motif containing protein [Candidatus Kirkpatrickella diaphorinae]UYH50996.1 HNH endonuclease [Candidatus Kirkpatrickella diaphorinae]